MTNAPRPVSRATLDRFLSAWCPGSGVLEAADAFTCGEIVTLADLLAELGEPEAAASWRDAHRADLHPHEECA